MRRLVVVPHSIHSRGAKNLAASLSHEVGYKVHRVRPERVRRRQAIVLHGGTDKLTQMQCFEDNGVPHPDFTQQRATALTWLSEGATVVCRTLLRASEGRGIHIATTEAELIRAPLYTKYCPKLAEYRVHVVNGEVIDVQQKKRRSVVVDNRDSRIRNLANGYVFCHDGIVEPPTLRETSRLAVYSLGYTMGAVDLVYNAKHDRLLVLEVNACPGMSGSTPDIYAKALVKSFNGRMTT